MAIKSRTQQQRRDATSQAVLESACVLFGSRGYQHTALEDIAMDCGTTIRPIYHYFKSKKNLFLAVTEHMETQLLDALNRLKTSGKSPAALDAYWATFTAFSRDAAFRQIVLVDAPNVLGRDRWDNAPVVTLVIEIICPLFPQLGKPSQILIARMIIAALTEAAMALSEPGNIEKEKAFEEVSTLIRRLTGVMPTSVQSQS